MLLARAPRSLILCMIATSLLQSARAADNTYLPYSTRTRAYSGWSTVVRGDIRTLGMAGAMVGIADTMIASGDNPAGLAMTFNSVGAQLARNTMHDGHIQDRDEALKSTNMGIGASIYPWGFSLGVWTPQNEGQEYILPSNGLKSRVEVTTREYRASIARVFSDNKLSIGGSWVLGQAVRKLEYTSRQDLSRSSHSYQLGFNLGTMYQLPHRMILGATFGLPLNYDDENGGDPIAGITDFFQPIKTPWRLGTGLGWIPNRFLDVGLGIYTIGASKDVALLRDDQQRVGERVTVQPRVGFNYTFLEYRRIKAHFSMGSYLEHPRITGLGARMHGTAGLQFNISIFNVGAALDRATNYENKIVAIGVDFIRAMRWLDLIPEQKQPPQGGWFPHPFTPVEDGLPRALSRDFKQYAETPGDVIEITKEIPERFQKKVESVVETLRSETPEKEKSEPVKPAPSQKKKPKRRRN